MSHKTKKAQHPQSKKASQRQQQQQQQQQQQAPAPDRGYYNYFNFESPNSAVGFRKAQQPGTGLWNVYAATSPDKEARKRRERREIKERLRSQDPERAAALALSDDETSEELRKLEAPPHAKSNERLVASALRSIKLADLCVHYCEIASAIGGSVDDGGEGARHAILLWRDFQDRVLRERTDADGSARPFPYKWPIESIDVRAQHLLVTDTRIELLETFGRVACARRDIKAFELLDRKMTLSLYVHVAGLTAPLLAETFDASQRDEAERTLDAWRRRANAQRLDPTLDFEDRAPLPAEQRRRERSAASDVDTSATAQARASSNISKVTLDGVKSLHDERRALDEFVEKVERKAAAAAAAGLNGAAGGLSDDDDDDDDADRDDKLPAKAFVKKKRTRDDAAAPVIKIGTGGGENGPNMSAAAAYMDQPPIVVTAKKPDGDDE